MKARDEEDDVDPFLCRCSKCKKFWEDFFSENDVEKLKESPLKRALKSNCLYESVKKGEQHAAVLKIGDRVMVNPGELKGVVKYLGPLEDNLVAPELYVGIHLDDQVGSVHNGIVNCKRYFHCPRGHGLMVKYGQVVRINQSLKKPPISGNYMFPSFEEIRRRRRYRSLLDPELDLGPLYTAKGAATGKKTQKNKKEKGGRKATKQEQTSAELRDYTKEPPRELISRWNKEKFGGGKEGEVKAKTLYKLYAAYQKGQQYKKAEENGDVTSSDESSLEDDDMGRQQDNKAENVETVTKFT